MSTQRCFHFHISHVCLQDLSQWCSSERHSPLISPRTTGTTEDLRARAVMGHDCLYMRLCACVFTAACALKQCHTIWEITFYTEGQSQMHTLTEMLTGSTSKKVTVSNIANKCFYWILQHVQSAVCVYSHTPSAFFSFFFGLRHMET